MSHFGSEEVSFNLLKDVFRLVALSLVRRGAFELG